MDFRSWLRSLWFSREVPGLTGLVLLICAWVWAILTAWRSGALLLFGRPEWTAQTINLHRSSAFDWVLLPMDLFVVAVVLVRLATPKAGWREKMLLLLLLIAEGLSLLQLDDPVAFGLKREVTMTFLALSLLMFVVLYLNRRTTSSELLKIAVGKYIPFRKE